MAKRDVQIGAMRLPGILSMPPAPNGLVIFAHGSGSSRLSPRNAHAAEVLAEHGFATLLFDLLTPAESQDRRNVFDIKLLAHRLVDAIVWARADERLHDAPIGLFGASTGAGAAIVAAAAREDVAAVVSRGGRPDLAGEALSRLAAPTLLIVGGEDREVLALNEDAQRRMGGPTAIHIVPDATHLFEEPGTLDEALNAAASWFETHLKPSPA